MNYHQLGNSTLQISEIGFGCMSLAGNDDANAKILHRAIDLGINFFDTADLYNKGMNEISVGKALKAKRNEIVLATKVGNQWRTDGSGWDWNPRKDYILQSVNDSLKRLQTDCIDLYQLHGGTIDDPIDETISAFELLKEQGKIRHYGISSIRPNVIREYINRSSIVSVMMQYSLLDRRPEETFLDLLKENNIGVLVRGSIAQGLLVDKPAKEYLQYSMQEVSNANEAIRTVSGSQRSFTQSAIRYVLNHPAVLSAVVGIRTIEQLEEAVKTATTPGLSTHEIVALQNSNKANRYDQHR
ncbi:MAG: aldo/keto reductase [Chitinophagaceae bacterium]|nr:aldo/keto reductase [Chitinophagaceae bacterium]